MTFSNPLEFLFDIGRSVLNACYVFGTSLSVPLIPDVPVVHELINILEAINYFNPLYQFSMYMLGINSLFDITIIHVLTGNLVLLAGYQVVKWVLDIVL